MVICVIYVVVIYEAESSVKIYKLRVQNYFFYLDLEHF